MELKPFLVILKSFMEVLVHDDVIGGVGLPGNHHQAVIISHDEGAVMQISTVLGNVYHVASGRVLSNTAF